MLSEAFRSRALAAGLDLFAFTPETLTLAQRQRLERELDQYLADELEYERSLSLVLRQSEGTPIGMERKMGSDTFYSL